MRIQITLSETVIEMARRVARKEERPLRMELAMLIREALIARGEYVTEMERKGGESRDQAADGGDSAARTAPTAAEAELGRR